jgi:hypothetical protein
LFFLNITVKGEDRSENLRWFIPRMINFLEATGRCLKNVFFKEASEVYVQFTLSTFSFIFLRAGKVADLDYEVLVVEQVREHFLFLKKSLLVRATMRCLTRVPSSMLALNFR